jgi:drug/metabolite transporter (DMT)-like permease
VLTGIGYGLGAAVCFGLTDVLTALASRRFGSLLTVAASQAASLVLLLILGFALEGRLPIDDRVFLPALALGVLSGMSYVTFSMALRLGPITVVSPVVSAYGGLTVVLAVLLLHESLTGNQALGALVSTIGILLVGVRFASDWRRTRFVGPGVPFALVALVGFGVLTVGLTGPIALAGWLPVLFGLRIANTATAWVALGAARLVTARSIAVPPAEPDPDSIEAELDAESVLAHGPMRAGIPWRGVAILLAAGTLDLTGFVLYVVGLQEAETWLVGLISSFGPAIAVLVAIALLRERLRPLQWAGLAVLVGGVVLVGWRS